MIRKIAITGPESTGKSVLAEQLASRYQTYWVPEFARTYLETLGRPYREEDILTIAQGQLRQEESVLSDASDYLFCDTEFLVTKIWSLVRYGRCDSWIDEQFFNHRYDLYLLCDIDLPWEYDPLREHPDRRKFLYDYYRRELTDAKFPFAVVRGCGPDRLNQAIHIIETFNF